MGELIKTTPSICKRCKYSMRFGSQSKDQNATKTNICCNYMEIAGHSRILINGRMAYDPKYCDKYEKGRKPKKTIIIKKGAFCIDYEREDGFW